MSIEQQHAQVMHALGEIKGELRSVHPTIARQRQDHERLEARTRVLENWKWYLAGLFSLTLVGSIVGFILG
jgi:hypothetical protein